MCITTRHVTISLILSLPFLGGCSTFSKPAHPPAPLVSFKPTFIVKNAWTADIGKAGQYQFYPAVVGTQIYAAAANGYLIKLDGSDGKIIWKINVGSNLKAGVGADQNTVAIVADKGIVKAFDVSGTLLWSAQANSEVLSPPNVVDGLVIIRSIDNHIEAFDAQTGKLRWIVQRPLPSLVLDVAPQFVTKGPLIFFGMPAGHLLAVSTVTGTVSWDAKVAEEHGSTEIERIIDIPGTPATNANEVCAASYQGKLTCFSASSGAPAWSRDFSTHVGVTLDNNAVYAVDEKSHVFAYAAQNGKSIWKNDQLNYRHLSTPLDIGKAIVLGDYDGHIHFLSPVSGELLARTATDSSPILATPMILGDNVLIQTQAGHIYALKIE